MTADDATESPAGSPETARRTAGTAAQATSWAFAFLILRIFAVSGYKWDTTFKVSTTLGLDDGIGLVFGTLMAGPILAAVLVIVVLPLLAATYLWGPRGRRPVVVLLSTVGLVSMVALTVSYRSWWLPVAAAAVFAMFALIRGLLPKRRLRRVLMAAMSRVGLVAGVGVLLVAAFTQTPWAPHELIETTHGTVAGYVLSVDSGYLNVLTDEHEFVILISGNVISRQ